MPVVTTIRYQAIPQKLLGKNNFCKEVKVPAPLAEKNRKILFERFPEYEMLFKRSRGANVPICVSLCPFYCVCLGLFLCLCLCLCLRPDEYEMVFKRSRGANVPIKKSPRSEWLPHCQDSWEKTQHLPSRQILVLRS